MTRFAVIKNDASKIRKQNKNTQNQRISKVQIMTKIPKIELNQLHE